MTIKDVENKVGITKANIRYYENEGLISPKRNDTNNYREYSEQDIEQLERIKVLRVLGIPISDIRDLKDGKLNLDAVMENRLKLLHEEEQNLEAVRRVCENLRQCHLPFDSVSESILEEDEASWGEQLAKVLKEDITKEILTSKQFNKSLALMLSYGYCICAVVSFLLGDWMYSSSDGICLPRKLMGSPGMMENAFPFADTIGTFFFFPVILCIICYIGMYFTKNTTILMVIFHINAINLVPLLIAAYTFARNCIFPWKDASISGMHLSLFCLMTAAYVVILFLLSRTWKHFFTKARHVIAAALGYTAVMTLIGGTLSGMWTAFFIGFFLFTMYIGLNWFHAYHDANNNNRYFAVTEGLRIMNILGTAFDMRGKTIPTWVQR